MGGNENLCLQLIKYSPGEVEHILVNIDPTRLEMLPTFREIARLKIIDFPYQPRNKLLFVFALAKFFWREKPDVVLVQPFGLHILVGLSARIAGIDLIVTRAGNPVPPSNQSKHQWKRIIQLSRVLRIPIHACSQATHDSLQALTPLPKHSFPIPNGCDIKDIVKRSKAARRNLYDPESTVIGMVARLDLIKDQVTLVQAFGLLLKTCSNLELWLIGEGDRRDYLMHLCERLGLTGKVKFLGSRSDIPELLGQIDIYAFSTTDDEGFGIALIEAMAASLPVVASDVAACREVLGDGAAGILVPSQDASAMAKALETFVLSSDQRQRWGQLAYRRAAEHYSIKLCAQRWYDRLLHSKERV